MVTMPEVRTRESATTYSHSYSNATGGTWERLGPPADPVPFDGPELCRGKRGTVLLHDPNAENPYEVAKNVLFRDFSASGDLPNVAYQRLPFSQPMATAMGHTEVCRVLQRCEPIIDGDLVAFELTNQCVAVKVSNSGRMDQGPDLIDNPLMEISTLQLLGENPIHVVGAWEVLWDGQNINLVTQFCGRADLFQILVDSSKRPTPGLTEPEARYWFRQVLDGVLFLHCKGVCLRRLCPESILIQNKTAYIADTSGCLRVPYVNPVNGRGPVSLERSRGQCRCRIRPQGPCGKLPYMAPELYTNQEAFDGVAVDVWACGTILFCLLTGNRSYQRPHPSDTQFYWMTRGLRKLLRDWKVHLSEDATTLLEGMLQMDARKRFTIDQVRGHPWLAAREPMRASY